MSTGTVRLHRVLRCTPEQLYRAFTSPDAWAKWLPPHGFTGRVHEMDVREGGSYRMSFTHLASGHTHSFGGRFVELVPGQRLRYTATFDDPSLPGEMADTVTMAAVTGGTELHVVQDGILEAIPLASCYLGWQQSLTLLAQLVEGGNPEG